MTARLIAIPLFALLMAICARITAPMTPVPMTMQTFAVLLAGSILGVRWGTGSVVAYLALAAVGLPVLSDGAAGLDSFSGPTAGYLFAFPIAAAIMGATSQRTGPRGLAIALGGALLAHLVILGLGVAWLMRSIPVSEAFAVGFTPFLPGAMIKSVLVIATWVGCRKIFPPRS